MKYIWSPLGQSGARSEAASHEERSQKNRDFSEEAIRAIRVGNTFNHILLSKPSSLSDL